MERDKSPERRKLPIDRSRLLETLMESLQKLSTLQKDRPHIPWSLNDVLEPDLQQLAKPYLVAIEKIQLAPLPIYENELAAQVFAIFVHDLLSPEHISRTTFRDQSGALFTLRGGLTLDVCGFNFGLAQGFRLSIDNGQSRVERARLFLSHISEKIKP